MDKKEKSEHHVRAGRARWLSMSAEQRRAFTSAAGKKGAAKTREKWLKLTGKRLSTRDRNKSA